MPLENSLIQFRIETTIDISRESNRHRPLKIVEKSTRYVNLEGDYYDSKSLIDHINEMNKDIDKTVKWNQRLIYPQVEFIGVSKELCNWALNTCKIPLKSTHFVPNIIQYQPFYGVPILDSKKLSFLATCNIRRTKNIEFLIDLFYKINKNNQHKLTIIGQPYDGIYYEELKLKISLHNLNDSIEFVHDCKDIQPILKNYDLAFHSALSESGPLVLIEYLSQGLPFLTYRTGDIPEMLHSDFSNFILDDFDIIKWESACEIVLSMNRTEVSKRMRNYYELNFSEESYYLKCKKIYDQALSY
jgi:glycosyltransferase involved in cell wall biosynthesis